jgi:hypothetical protein
MHLILLLVAVLTTPSDANVGPGLPRLEAKAFDGRPLVLPDSAAGSITLVGLGYKRESQDDLSSWLLQFGKEYRPEDGFRAYEIPMMGKRIPGVLRGIINTAMRNVIPRDKRRWFAPYYGDIDDYSRQLAITDREKVHMLLLDRAGTVRWQTAGRADSSRLAELRSEITRLLAEEK